MSEQEERLGYGEDTLRATVWGADIPALKMAALDEARRLFGPDAVLQVERVSSIMNGWGSHTGEFHADVIVRRADDGPEWVSPGDLDA